MTIHTYITLILYIQRSLPLWHIYISNILFSHFLHARLYFRLLKRSCCRNSHTLKRNCWVFASRCHHQLISQHAFVKGCSGASSKWANGRTHLKGGLGASAKLGLIEVIWRAEWPVWVAEAAQPTTPTVLSWYRYRCIQMYNSNKY